MDKKSLVKIDSLSASLLDEAYNLSSSLSQYLDVVNYYDDPENLEQDSIEELESSFSEALVDANKLAVLVSGMTFHLGELHAHHKKTLEDLKTKPEKKVHKAGCPAGKKKIYCRDSKGRFA